MSLRHRMVSASLPQGKHTSEKREQEQKRKNGPHFEMPVLSQGWAEPTQELPFPTRTPLAHITWSHKARCAEHQQPLTLEVLVPIGAFQVINACVHSDQTPQTKHTKIHVPTRKLNKGVSQAVSSYQVYACHKICMQRLLEQSINSETRPIVMLTMANWANTLRSLSWQTRMRAVCPTSTFARQCSRLAVASAQVANAQKHRRKENLKTSKANVCKSGIKQALASRKTDKRCPASVWQSLGRTHVRKHSSCKQKEKF